MFLHCVVYVSQIFFVIAKVGNYEKSYVEITKSQIEKSQVEPFRPCVSSVSFHVIESSSKRAAKQYTELPTPETPQGGQQHSPGANECDVKEQKAVGTRTSCSSTVTRISF